MSDNLENFVRKNSEQFNRQQPRTELWDKIQTGLAQQAAAGTAAGTTAATKTATGVAKFASAWKLAAIGVAVAVVGVTTILLVSGGEKKDGKDNTSTQPIAATNKVEPDANTAPFINPPLPSADVPYQIFTIDAHKGGEINLPNGTLIQIPTDAFLAEGGKMAEGPVEIRYREFHDAADIILSGIPMAYNNNGKMETFETAGMIEVLGFQNNKEVKVAPGKDLKFEMASYVTEDNYNFYFLDPEKREWKDIGKAKLAKNKRKQSNGLMVERMEAPRKPIGPKEATKDGEIGFQVNYADFPELKPFKKIRWVASDPAFLKANNWIFSMVWNDIELQEVPGDRMAYNMVLRNKRKTFTLPAMPVLDGEEYEKAMKEFNAQKAKYDNLLAQRKNQGDRLKLQADVTRSFSVAGFGIFNCDRFASMKDAVTVRGSFDFGEDTYMQGNNTTIFQVLSDRSARPLEHNAQDQSVTFSKSGNQHLLAILPDGTLAYFGPEDFRKIDVNDGGKYTFKMQHTGRKINSAFDIREALGV